MSEQSRSEHILELSKELLDDIELSRTNVENLILKASRLARLVGSEEIRQWLKFEMGGYNSSDELSLKYMGLTGRWIDKEKNTLKMQNKIPKHNNNIFVIYLTLHYKHSNILKE